MAEIDLQDPFQGRLWLKLLVEDSRCGFRLRPNLEISRQELGFSFRSNLLGLRGPAAVGASRVILGTSFTMGIAVNNGENWYEHCLTDSKWLNLGLAVGIREWAELIDMHHSGPKGLVILMYHPNIWIHCLLYERWRASRKGLFETLRWETSRLKCAKIAVRKNIKRQIARYRGEHFSVLNNNVMYEIDALYARIPHSEIEVFDRNISQLKRILEAFNHTIVIRIPVKQQLVESEMRPTALVSQLQEYEELWQKTLSALKTLKSISVFTPDIFNLSHYHAKDTHWNASGNRAFANWLEKNGLAE